MTAGHGCETAPAGQAAPHSTATILYDPAGLIEAQLRFDRAPYECLIKAVLAWTGPDTLRERDYQQIALQLTACARAAAADVQRHADQLPADSGRRALADVVLREAQAQLSAPLEGTVRCVQHRARLVRALYERLDRLERPEVSATAALRAAGGGQEAPARYPSGLPLAPGTSL